MKRCSFWPRSAYILSSLISPLSYRNLPPLIISCLYCCLQICPVLSHPLKKRSFDSTLPSSYHCLLPFTANFQKISTVVVSTSHPNHFSVLCNLSSLPISQKKLPSKINKDLLIIPSNVYFSVLILTVLKHMTLLMTPNLLDPLSSLGFQKLLSFSCFSYLIIFYPSILPYALNPLNPFPPFLCDLQYLHLCSLLSQCIFPELPPPYNFVNQLNSTSSSILNWFASLSYHYSLFAKPQH